MTITGKTIGERLIRARKNISQKKLAELANVSHISIQKWEADKNEPSLNNIKKMAKALNISPIELAFGDLIKEEEKEMLSNLISLDKDEKKTIREVIEAFAIRHTARKVMRN